MPPPKMGLHKTSGKLKSIQKTNVVSPQNLINPSHSLENEVDVEQKLEVELMWCVQQLEISLQLGKLSAKQVEDVEKNIKILKSKTQPTIKKRQLMRSLFGDYRSKMAKEEKKMSLANRQIKFTDSKTNSTSKKKSYFVRKSAVLNLGKEFKFNFATDQLNDLSIEDKNEDIKIEHKSSDNQCNVIKQSNNSFRFNFNVD